MVPCTLEKDVRDNDADAALGGNEERRSSEEGLSSVKQSVTTTLQKNTQQKVSFKFTPRIEFEELWNVELCMKFQWVF